MTDSTKSRCFWGCVLGSLLLAGTHSLPAGEQKLKIEEIVEGHLASVGPPEARAAAKRRVARGTAQATFRMPMPGQLPGTGEFLSDGRKMRVVLRFGSQEYQREELVFDGRKVDVAQIDIRVRSHLSQFVFDYNVLMREGLMGGTITTSWALLDLVDRQPRLDYSGLKKIDGRRLHEVKYRARRGSGNLQVGVYFEPETFRHVHSEYRLGSACKVQEWFDDFRPIDSLSLPHAYRLAYSSQGSSGTTMFEYAVSLSQIIHNPAVEPVSFTIQNRLGR